MSQKEVKRLEILQKVNNKHMRQNKAAEALNLSVRQIQRLLKTVRLQGPEGLISKKRGKPANNRISDATREMAIFYIRNQYHDFGPTLASENMAVLRHMAMNLARKDPGKGSLCGKRKKAGWCDKYFLNLITSNF